MMLEPRTDLEKKILEDRDVQEGLQWGKPRRYHEEGTVIKHVQQMWNFIDDQLQWVSQQDELRLLTLLHDAFKHRQHEQGGPNHATLAAQYYAELVPGDERIRLILKHHDHPWSWYKKGDRLDMKRVAAICKNLDLPLFLRFKYVDNSAKGWMPVDWFEQLVYDLNLPNAPATRISEEVRRDVPIRYD